MAGKRRERSLSRSSHYRSKPLIDLFVDRINIDKFSRHRIADSEGEEDTVETAGAPQTPTESTPVEISSPPLQESTPLPPRPPPDPNKYTPVPYTFRIPVGPQTKEVRRSYARCPPFYLQLDHTLAVIWCLFSKQPPAKPLGIAQLQWALNFLKAIKNQNGEQPKDILLCIHAIQDQLLETYAALVDELEDDEVETTKPTKKTTEGGTEEAPKSATDIDGPCKVDTCENLNAPFSFKRSGDRLTGRARDVQSDVIITNLPFSVNYMEMMRSSPNAMEKCFTSQINKSLTDAQIQQEIEHLRKATAATMPDSNLGETRSRDDMLRFLNLWRKEQLEKVQAELKRLHSIENFIDNVDKEGSKVPEKKSAKKVSIKEPANATV